MSRRIHWYIPIPWWLLLIWWAYVAVFYVVACTVFAVGWVLVALLVRLPLAAVRKYRSRRRRLTARE